LKWFSGYHRSKRREVKILAGRGGSLVEAVCTTGVTEQTCCWRKEYG
jgi:hypothetical protein